MALYDVSLPIQSGMLHWPSDPPVELSPHKTVVEGGSNVTLLSTGTHVGTHIDAPKHFADQGIGVDALPLESLIGPCVALDLTHVDLDIGVDDLVGKVSPGTERVLLKTRNSTDRLLHQEFTESYVALSGAAAAWLAEHNVKLVGCDYLSVQRRGADRQAHTALLDKQIAIIEALDLEHIAAGHYTLYALPLRIAGGDGAPARVILED